MGKLHKIAFLLLLAASCLVGCRSYAIRPQSFQPAPVDAKATAIAFEGDSLRLADDVWRTIRDLNWGLMKLQTSPWPCDGNGNPILTDASATSPASQPATAGGPTCTLVEARALLADGRIAHIHAWGRAGNPLQARVRIGELGDAAVEAAFLQQLQATFAMKPRPQRGGYFDLPPYPPK